MEKVNEKERNVDRHCYQMLGYLDHFYAIAVVVVVSRVLLP